MSGAQAKAAVIAGCVGVVAEVRRFISLPHRGTFSIWLDWRFHVRMLDQRQKLWVNIYIIGVDMWHQRLDSLSVISPIGTRVLGYIFRSVSVRWLPISFPNWRKGSGLCYHSFLINPIFWTSSVRVTELLRLLPVHLPLCIFCCTAMSDPTLLRSANAYYSARAPEMAML